MKEEKLKILYSEMQRCNKCEISNLPENKGERLEGSGDLNSKIMMIGIAPSYYRGGKKMIFEGKGVFSTDSPTDRIVYLALENINLKRMDVFMTNILKCSTPFNREPTESEMNNCSYFLIKEIDIIKPKLIYLMGNIPCSYFKIKIGELRYDIQLDSFLAGIFHPTYAYRYDKKEIFIKQVENAYRRVFEKC
jgi:DNA polymerase